MFKIKYFHFAAYVILMSILIIGTWLFFLSKGLPDRQMTIIGFMAIFYFCWGITFHLLEGDLHPKIVVEYLLIALLAVFLLKGAVYR